MSTYCCCRRPRFLVPVSVSSQLQGLKHCLASVVYINSLTHKHKSIKKKIIFLIGGGAKGNLPLPLSLLCSLTKREEVSLAMHSHHSIQPHPRFKKLDLVNHMSKTTKLQAISHVL